MIRLFKGLIITIIALIGLVGCSEKEQPSNNFADADGYGVADSIISAISDERDWNKFLATCDSFERVGDISKAKSIFYKTVAHNLLGHQRKSLSLYNQLAEIDEKELKTEADRESYIYAYKDYVRTLCEMRRYDRALRQARIADRKLRSIGFNSFADHQDIAQIIGECQLCLGQTNEAQQNFNRSLAAMQRRLIKNHGSIDLRECQKTMNAIANVLMRRRMFDQVQPWLEREETLYAKAQCVPDRDSVYLDEMKAEIEYIRAMLATAQGRTDEGEKAYAAYMSTNTAKQPGSIFNSCRYLMAKGRYKEAAANYAQLDKYMHDYGYEIDLENIGRFMIPKYHVNLLAGRKDSALQVATQIANSYDSALVRQKMIDADLLATVYDTEGKERQIAEQQARLSHQRMLWVLGVGIALIILLHIHLVIRRKAYKKLNDTNRKLVEANERAEESARMKTKFIHQISHEVRTPLNVLSGFTQVLASPNIEISSDELQSISKKIVENSERITHLVDKMLDLSLVNSDAAIECNDMVRPADAARNAIEQSGIRNAKHLEFSLQIQPEIENIQIATSRKCCTKVLALLLDNAIKFTHPLAFHGSKPAEGKAQVSLSLSTDGNAIKYVVQDTGIGVPADQAENIFKEFVQLDEYSDGTGIGLSIARQLARHMGGDITLDTTYTAGARFIVTLPCRDL
jgi:signal transduction histidine kinase